MRAYVDADFLLGLALFVLVVVAGVVNSATGAASGYAVLRGGRSRPEDEVKSLHALRVWMFRSALLVFGHLFLSFARILSGGFT